jgi:Cytochrome oxidase complex assembly protein 1
MKMSKDPLESERQMRQMIGRAALEERRPRGVRRSLRGLKVLASLFFSRVGLLVLLILACFGGFFVVIFGVAVKWTEAYDCSVAEARRSPAVVAELGEPVEAGFFAWTHSYSREGSVTDTAFRTSLSGPKGEGTLRVQWYNSPVGSSLRMELEKEGRKQLVYSGPIPCR